MVTDNGNSSSRGSAKFNQWNITPAEVQAFLAKLEYEEVMAEAEKIVKESKDKHSDSRNKIA